MNNSTKGFLYCVASYLIWGILPIYWKLLSSYAPLTILAHRIVWCLVFTFLLLFFLKRLKELKEALFNPGNLLSLALRSFFVSANWLIYVWAVNNGNILACSLGYFICPITAVLLGVVVLKEKFSKKQLIAIIIVFAAILNLIINYGHFPWTSIGIALTFAIYGLLKKTAEVESLPGLSAETAVLSIPALIYLFATGSNSPLTAIQNTSITMMLIFIGTGIITATPLLLYTYGVRRVKISTAGILQYITPTSTFLLGIFMYHEKFTLTQLITYALIWFSIILYIYDMFTNLPEREISGSKK